MIPSQLYPTNFLKITIDNLEFVRKGEKMVLLLLYKSGIRNSNGAYSRTNEAGC